MKIKKSIKIISLSLLSVLALAACNNTDNGSSGSNSNTTVSPTTATSNTATSTKPMKTVVSSYFSSISLDTSNVQNVFYFGDKFNSDGLSVKNNFVQVFSDNTRSSISYTAENFSVDSSEVDLNKVGTYPVTVTSRSGTTIRKQSYNVVVKSNPYDDVKGLSYFSGLEVKYSGEDQFEKTYKVQDSFSMDNISLVTKVRKVTIDENGEKVETDVNMRTSYLTIDTSNIPVDSNGKLTTRGVFQIKYSYIQKLTINGKEVQNKIETFTLIHVTNPVTSIEKVSTNDTTFEASIKQFDLSNWKFKITREIGEPEIVNYSSDLFTSAGINQYVEGDQVCTVALKESPAYIVGVPVKVTESSKYNISIVNKLYSCEVKAETLELEDKDEKKYFFDEEKGRWWRINKKTGENGEILKEIEESDEKSFTSYTKMDEDGYCYGKNFTSKVKPNTCDGTSLLIRTKVEANSKGAYFEVNMPKAGKLLIFLSSTGNDSRPVSITHNDELYGEVYAVNNQPVKCEIDIEEAGTYRFTCAKTIYVYGVIVATER